MSNILVSLKNLYYYIILTLFCNNLLKESNYHISNFSYEFYAIPLFIARIVLVNLKVGVFTVGRVVKM